MLEYSFRIIDYDGKRFYKSVKDNSISIKGLLQMFIDSWKFIRFFPHHPAIFNNFT